MPEDLRLVSDLAGPAPGLELLLLFGSPGAGGMPTPAPTGISAIWRAPPSTPTIFQARLVLGLKTDRIDLVNLGHTSGLLRYRVAAEGSAHLREESRQFRTLLVQSRLFLVGHGADLQGGLRGDPPGPGALMGRLDRELLGEKAAIHRAASLSDRRTSA